MMSLRCKIVLAIQLLTIVARAIALERLRPPVVINTWNFTNANVKAWQQLAASKSAMDAIEAGCSQCEIERCDGTVGWGGSPSENGETTLDAMIMDGTTYDVGAVGGLRRVKSAISVARLVLEKTNHTLLVGEMATQFALALGFKEESLTSDESARVQDNWRRNSCQPNFWKNVEPNPRTSCGPYHLPRNDRSPREESPRSVNHSNNFQQILLSGSNTNNNNNSRTEFVHGHDTIGMIAIDSRGKIAAGTSTNGLEHKILGRVGDSPIPGAGSYAAKEAGAAAATGDGDVMMRFLLSYQAVENLRRGLDAQQAADNVIQRQIRRTGRPYPQAAVVVLSIDGSFGAACCGFNKFPFVISDSIRQYRVMEVMCSR